MSAPETPNRRHFIASVAGMAAVASVLPLERASAGAGAGGVSSRAADGKWDDSWTERLGKHRVVFEQWDLEQEPAPALMVPSVMDGYNEALGTRDSDLGVVLVLRHRAVPYFFGDAMWAKYDIAKHMKQVNEKTNAPWRVNPMGEHVRSLQRRGVTVLGCNRAVSAFINLRAQETKGDAKEIGDEVRANIFPGVILQPNGLYAVARAQDVGCGIMR